MSPYAILAAVLAFVLNGFFWYAKGSNNADERWTAKITVERLQATEAARAKETEDRLRKDKSDVENMRTTARLRADIARLRQSNLSSGNLSSPTTSAASPNRTCFDPSKLDSALRILDAGVLGIVETGSQAVTDLDSAKLWGKDLK